MSYMSKWYSQCTLPHIDELGRNIGNATYTDISAYSDVGPRDNQMRAVWSGPQGSGTPVKCPLCQMASPDLNSISKHLYS